MMSINARVIKLSTQRDIELNICIHVMGTSACPESHSQYSFLGDDFNWFRMEIFLQTNG